MTKPNLALHDRIKPYIIPVTESGCLLWEGASSRGYGVLNVKKKLQYVHRLMWELRNGPIQDGLCALHKCDVPSCINIEHLFLGTSADNNIDCTKKGRNMRNEKGMFASKRKSGAH